MEVIEKILIETLQAQLGKTNEELQALLYEKLDEKSETLTLKTNVQDLILELDALRVDSIKTNVATEWEKKVDKIKKDQLGKGKKEGLQELETLLVEQFEIDAKDLKGIELIKEIIKANTKSTLTADEIKRHPSFLELEGRIKTDYVLKSEFDTVKTEHEKYVYDLERNKRIKKQRDSALITLRGMKLKMAEDANIKANQEELFLKAFIDNLNIDEKTEDLILLKEDGTRMEDKHGIAIPLSKYVEQVAPTQFEMLVQGSGGGAGNRNEGGEGSSFKKPETEAEFLRACEGLKGQELIDYHEKYTSLFK